MSQELNGFLCTQFAQGDEHVWWAFQDSRFIEPNISRFVCKQCGIYWDKESNTTST